jgi:hypothetical protein
MSKVFATYTKHHRDDPEGHIYLDKEGACTITLSGAASMKQRELDAFAAHMVGGLNRSIEKSKDCEAEDV